MASAHDLWPDADGELAGRIRTFDWASTPLGPIAGWPQSLRTIVDLMLRSPSMMSLVWGAEAIHLYNDSFTDLLREHPHRSLGRSAYETFARSRDVFAADVAAGMAGRSARLLAQRYPVLRQGRLEDAWFDVDYAPIHDETGAVAGVLWTLKETTAQLLAEQALRASEERHRLLIESWTQAVWETDAAGVVTADSPSWRTYTGQTVEQWLGYCWLDAIHPDDRAYAERQWREAVAARRAVDAEFRLRAPGGGWRWTNVRAAPVIDAQGDIAKWAGVNIDIDARKRAEEAVRTSEAKLRTVFESIDEGFLIHEVIRDENGRPIDLRMLEANPALTRLTGLGQDLIGKAQRAVMPDLEQVWIDTFDRVARTGVPERFENYNQPTGRWYNVRISQVGGHDDQVAVVYDDVTARKLSEIALRESEERQAFLLKLSDALRPLADAGEIQAASARLLGAHLGVDRAMYAEVTGEPGAETGVIRGQFIRTAASGRPAPAPFPDHFAYESFGVEVMARRYSGEGLAVADVEVDAGFDATERAAWASVGVRAAIVAPLVKGSRLVAELGVHSETSRTWTDTEISLVREVGERTWAAAERARAEATLRESEEKYRSVFEAIDEGFCIWDVVQDANRRIVDLRFVEVNPAFERQTGLSHVVGRLVSEVAPGTETEWIETYGEVARTGAAKRFEMHHAATGRWYDIYASQLRGFHSPRVSIVFRDITERRRAEMVERDSKERQAFLLTLSDALRAQPDADAMALFALRALAERLHLDRCYIAEYRLDEDRGNIRYQVSNDRGPSLPRTIRLSDFPAALKIARGGTLVIDHVGEADFLSDVDKRNIAGLGMGALVTAAARKGDNVPLFAIVAVSALPRGWTPGEIALVEEVNERTWAAVERAHAEAASRASEERFRQFADASAAALWIRASDTLAMEFVSPAIATIYGVDQDALLGAATRWAALIVPEDRDAALAHLEQARSGEVAVHEFRIQRPSDGAFRWIRNTDFPLRDNGHIPRIGGIAEDVTDAKLAAEHSAVLLAELQHRVRNIMALLRSITNRTAERAGSVPEYRDAMMGRLLAFARVQALLTRTAKANVGIASIVRDEVSVQAQHEGQYVLDGPDVALSPKAAEVLTLAIHELATNAVKYGALSVPDGKITVRWSTVEKHGGPWLALDWTEEGAPARPAPAAPNTPRRRGFGSELIEGRIPYELKGHGQVAIAPGGARCHLAFPLQSGASILETGAPQRATVFGGAIDMTGEPDLTGRRVLVVEDDYYLATDAARALRGVGADVMGPCATEEDARIALDAQRPDAVVLDINLGPGPSFKLAEALKDRGIPFVFTTGYDAEVIPAEFESVERLEKPLQLRQIVGAVAKLTTAA